MNDNLIEQTDSSSNLLYSSDDSLDPTYKPEKDLKDKNRNRIPDYFGVRQIQPVKSKPITYDYDKDLASTSTSSNISQNFSEHVTTIDIDTNTPSINTNIMNINIINEAFENCPYLDGKFFKVISSVQHKNQNTSVTAECQLCLPKKVPIKGALGVSTNFLKHLKKSHSNQDAFKSYSDYKEMKKQSRLTRNSRSTKRSASSAIEDSDDSQVGTKRQRKITECLQKKATPQESQVNQNVFEKRLITFVVNTMSPVAILDNPSFVQIFDGMGVNVISRNTAMKRLQTIYNKTLADIKQEIKQVRYVCTTADIWSAKKRSFFGLTVHWINNNFERCSAALACKRFSGSHTFDKIAEILDDTHSKFDLDRGKLVATISDNGSNFVKAFKEFGLQSVTNEEDGDEENEESLEFQNIAENWETIESLTISLPKHVRCSSHTLNLIATTDIKNTIQKDISLRTRHTNVLAKCNSLWKMANRPKSAEIIQETLGHILSYPGQTRWNSLYDALTQIIQEKDHLQVLFEKLGINNQNQMLKDSEISFLTDYCQILKPLANSIDILQGDKNNFFGYLMPTLGSLFKKMERLENALEVSNPAYKILKACQEGLLKRFKDYFDFSNMEAKEAIVASFTLPKFKLRWIKNFESFYKDTEISDINSYVQTLVVKAAENIEVSKNSLTIDTSGIEDNAASADMMIDDFFELDGSHSPESLKNNNKRKFELEILQYAEDISTEIKSLDRFPVMKELFLRYNTCLPSSAPVERLFSFAEIVNAPRRHALSDSHFEQLVILKANGKRLLSLL